MPESRGPSRGQHTASARLDLVNLTKTYQGVAAVDNTTLAVHSGEFMTFLGPSGSGKTTTLMMIAGFTAPTSGDILLDGNSITASPPEDRNIGVVFQSYALFPHMTVFENVAFPLRMRAQGREEIRRSVKRSLELVKLSDLGERMPRQLSGGQQQRVALARALVFNPRLLLMDEPLGALDKKLREHMQGELKRLHKELGTTIIYVTHDQQEALTMSDRVALMNDGRIEQLGTAELLYNDPVNHFVADFVGESNLLRGRMEKQNRFVDGCGTVFEINAAMGQSFFGEECSLLLRPEDLSIHPQDPGDENSVTGRVEELLYVGDFIKYTIVSPKGTRLSVKYPHPKNADRVGDGEKVWLTWAKENARIIR